jgi:hypothetical protein
MLRTIQTKTVSEILQKAKGVLLMSFGSDCAPQWLPAVLAPYHAVMRTAMDDLVAVLNRLLGGKAAPYILSGLRLWLGAYILRKTITVVFLLFKILRRRTTMMLSLGTGSSHSSSRRDAWRATMPVTDSALAPLHTVQFVLYGGELAGQLCVASGLLWNTFFGDVLPGPLSAAQLIAQSVLTLRPLRIVLMYPVEFFFVYPLIYAIIKMRSLSAISKAKVTVTQNVNNYYGGQPIKKKEVYDAMLVAHLALEASGLPWCAKWFIVIRNSLLENGWSVTYSALRGDFFVWWRGEAFWRVALRACFIVATQPLYVAATLLAGTRRPGFVPAVADYHPVPFVPAAQESEQRNFAIPSLVPVAQAARQGLGYEGPPVIKNALVEVFTFPHGVGLELFTKGTSRLIGGDDLPEIAVLTDPRLMVKIPMRPVTNNTFALDMFALIKDHPAIQKLRELTKVPANAFRNGVELQKFISRRLDLDFDRVNRQGMTFREFAMVGLRMAYGLNSRSRVNVDHLKPDADPDDYLTPTTKKHHPGLTTRAFGGQDKITAWPYSIRRASNLWAHLMGGQSRCLSTHIWLLLGVVKKQATRKEFDEQYRCRGAVIPEQELQIVWTHLMKPVMKLLEEDSRSWGPKFELFHGALTRLWLKFEGLKDVSFGNSDKVDHGASMEREVAALIADFLGSLTYIDGVPSRQLYNMLFDEMIHAVVGLAGADGLVHLFKTGRGMKDGLFATSTIGGIYTIVGELWKIWNAWNGNPAAQKAWPDIFQVVATLVAEVHGDNSLVAYPRAVTPWMSDTNAAVAKTLSLIGLTVKIEESLLCDELTDAWCMSWHLAPLSTGSRPVIVAWKPTADILKSFMLPERLADFDHMSDSTRAYLGQILVSLYILGYWNGEARLFLDAAWFLLWQGQEEHIIRLVAVKDFLYKTGLDPSQIEPVSSQSEHPYPPEKVVRLWLKVTDCDKFIMRTAPGAPTLADGVRMVAPLRAMRESDSVAFGSSTVMMPYEDYDEEGLEGAGAFGRARPPGADLVGGLGGPALAAGAPWIVRIYVRYWIWCMTQIDPFMRRWHVRQQIVLWWFLYTQRTRVAAWWGRVLDAFPSFGNKIRFFGVLGAIRWYLVALYLRLRLRNVLHGQDFSRWNV